MKGLGLWVRGSGFRYQGLVVCILWFLVCSLWFVVQGLVCSLWFVVSGLSFGFWEIGVWIFGFWD